MAANKEVRIGLVASDNASPVFQKVASKAEVLKAKLQEMYALGNAKSMTTADLSRRLLGGVSGGSLEKAIGLAGIARSNVQVSPQVNAGTSSLVQRAVREHTDKLKAASEAMAEEAAKAKQVAEASVTLKRHMDSYSHVLSAAELQARMLGKGRAGSAVSAATGFGAGAPGVLLGRDTSIRGAIADQREAALARSLLADTGKNAKELEGNVSSLGGVLSSGKLMVAAWGAAVFTAGKEALEAAVRVDRLNKAYTTIEGSQQGAQMQLDYMYQKTRELGLQFYDTAEASKNFFASMRGTAIEGDANKIWEAVTKAGAALSLSGDDMESIFRSLGQMVSKGKVMAEELRGQLGERLPGAFQLAAKAMGVTTMELDKMLETGDVLADDLLPKLAVEIEKAFGPGAQQAAEGLQQNIHRVSTEWERFKASILDSELVSKILGDISNVMAAHNDFVQNVDRRKEVEAQMRAARIVPLGVRDVERGIWTVRGKYKEGFYTDEQVEAFVRAREESAKFYKESVENAQKAEAVLFSSSASISDYLKNTYTFERKRIDENYQTFIKSINDKIALYKKEGVDYSHLLELKKQGDKVYHDHLAELEKKHSKKADNTGPYTVDAVQKALNDIRNKQAAKEAKDYRQETRDLDMVADVMQELAEKTGQYGLAVESVNQLIDRQGELWLNAGVPQQYVGQLKEIRRLEASTDGLDKMKLSWMEFYAESMDWGTQAGSVLTGTVDSFSASLAEMAMTGKASFSDLARSMASDLTKIATKMMMVYMIEKALGWVTSSLTFNGLNADAATAAASTSGYAGMGQRWSGGSALGNVFVGAGSLHDYSGSIVSKPTLFTHGSRLPQYASGAGLMGEAGPEAVMPLTRIGGRLGVDASGMAPRVNLIINNNASGVDVQTSQRQNADGSLDIEATIVRVVQRDMDRRGGVINQSMRKTWGQRSIVTKR